MSRNRSVVVFDLGGVLIDWNPRYLYRKLFDGDDAAMEDFLANVCTSAWNAQQDAGRTFAEAGALLKLEHPKHGELIDAWFGRQREMVAGPISGTVDILAELHARGVPLYAVSNWSAETYPLVAKRFEFLQWFQAVVLSGEVRVLKPDPRIFQFFFDTYNIDPARAVYVDDLKPNVEAANALGMHGIVFTDPPALRIELVKLGLLGPIGDDGVRKMVLRESIMRRRGWEICNERGRSMSAGLRLRRDRCIRVRRGISNRIFFRSVRGAPGTDDDARESPRAAHLAISVGSRDAVDQLVRDMEAAGVRIMSAPRVTGDGYYEAVIADSEGNLIEITS